MILTVDIGNTTVSLCGLEPNGGKDHRVVFSGRLETVREKGRADYLSEMRALLEREGVNKSSLEGAAVSSVVPCLNGTLDSCVSELIGREAVWITAKSRTGLSIAVPEPERVGVDRLVDAAWAAAHFSLPVVTVDMGTATTFNVVDKDRRFLGGVIAPGLGTGLYALSGRAAQLPEVAISAPAQVIGRNTEECMRSGAVIGAAAMIDGLTARIEAELNAPVTMIITGGLAQCVQALCSHPHVYEPDMLAKGLAMLYDWNLC